VNVDRFLQDRESSWSELDDLIRRGRRRPGRLGAERIRRLGALYRSAAADLALARRQLPGDPVVVRLTDLVGRARHVVYGSAARRGSVVRFVTRDYWRLVAERPLPLLVSATLLFAPASLAGAWALHDRPAALGLVPSEFRDVTGSQRPWHEVPAGDQAAFSTAVLTNRQAVEDRHPWRDLSASDQAAFSTEVQANNIRVTAAAFAGGITLGLLTAASLIFNGVLLGAIGGLMIGAGNAVGFVDLVTGHGVLELTCIVVAGAAGLRLGWSIVDPGRRSRTASLVAEGRRSIGLVVGTAPWLVVAGIVEGFRATLSNAGLGAVVGVGVGLGALYWGLVVLLGRESEARERLGA